jgi:hypothetical protein
MEDLKSEASQKLMASPPSASCKHPALDYATPDLKCRICGDHYTDPADDDQPSDALLGE